MRKLIARTLSLTVHQQIKEPHRCNEHILPSKVETLAKGGRKDCVVELQVFVDDFVNGIAAPKGDPDLGGKMQLIGRVAMHGTHTVFPPPKW